MKYIDGNTLRDLPVLFSVQVSISTSTQLTHTHPISVKCFESCRHSGETKTYQFPHVDRPAEIRVDTHVNGELKIQR